MEFQHTVYLSQNLPVTSELWPCVLQLQMWGYSYLTHLSEFCSICLGAIGLAPHVATGLFDAHMTQHHLVRLEVIVFGWLIGLFCLLFSFWCWLLRFSCKNLFALLGFPWHDSSTPPRLPPWHLQDVLHQYLITSRIFAWFSEDF